MDDEARRLCRIMRETKTIAVVGLSPSSHRPSYVTAEYMLEHGYRIIPVNPHCESILGERCYPDLSAVPEPVDMVNCFRRADEIPALALQSQGLGLKSFWVQLGLSSPEARALVSDAGIDYVEDRCVRIEHARLIAGWHEEPE